MIWVCSDWHFNHNQSFIWEARGFHSIEEMNRSIVRKHNMLVSEQDDVYVLGDLCLGGAEKLDENRKLISSMSGRLHIIAGNHDTAKRLEMYKILSNVIEVAYALPLKYKKYNFWLSHYPTLTSNYGSGEPLKTRVINICGHSHSTEPFSDIEKGLIYHCEMDAHNCYPCNLDDIIEEIRGVIF